MYRMIRFSFCCLLALSLVNSVHQTSAFADSADDLDDLIVVVAVDKVIDLEDPTNPTDGESATKENSANEECTKGEPCVTRIPDCSRCCRKQCSCSCSTTTVDVGVTFLQRSNATNIRLITDQGTGDEVQNTGDLGFDYQTAPWFNITHEYDNCWGWDIGFLGLDSWSDMQLTSESITPVLRLPQGIPVPTTGPNDVLSTTYGTDLYSFHWNARRKLNDSIDLVAGFRWMEVDDLLGVRQVQTSDRDLFSVEASNRMYGVQIGTDLDLLHHCKWDLSANLRGGIFYNRVSQSTRAPVLTGITGVVDNLDAKDDHTAFVGELGVTGRYFLSQRVALSAGYHLYWLEGIALAPNQIRTMDLTAPGTVAVDSGGSMFLNGATLGLSFTF